MSRSSSPTSAVDEGSGVYCPSMARRAEDLPTPPVVDVVADGLDDDEVAAAFATWLAELDDEQPIELPASAADELAAARAAGEV
jgi:hypothetical protein